MVAKVPIPEAMRPFYFNCPITGDILPLTVYDLWKEVHLGVELGVRVYQPNPKQIKPMQQPAKQRAGTRTHKRKDAATGLAAAGVKAEPASQSAGGDVAMADAGQPAASGRATRKKAKQS